jgi:hypothetical protein
MPLKSGSIPNIDTHQSLYNDAFQREERLYNAKQN